MKENINISISRNECTGCGACQASCPINAIEIVYEDFFYNPKVTNQCINCGKCVSVCPTTKCSDKKVKNAYCYSMSTDEILESASGGAATSIGKFVLENGGIVYGVKYSEDYRNAVYCRIEKKTDLVFIKGSKYLESYIPDFKSIKNDVNSGKKVCFFGLPCQIAAVHSFLGDEYNNLYLVGLMCLGKSSVELCKRFIDDTEKKYNSSVVYMNMRYQEKGWNTNWLKVNLQNGKIIKKPLLASGFGLLSKKYFRLSCYDCRFKIDNPFEDVLIGDFWGYEYLPPQYINNKGMSSIITLGEKGDSLIHSIEGNLNEVSYEDVIRANGAVVASRHIPDTYNEFMELLKKSEGLDEITKQYVGDKKLILLGIKYRLKYFLPSKLIIYLKKNIKRRNM